MSGERKARRGSMIVGAATTLLVALLMLIGVFDSLELRSLDARFYWRGEQPPQDEVVVVGIDEASFGALNLRWPWPRHVYADLVKALSDAGARVIGFDILFAESSEDPAEDDAFAAAMSEARNVLLANKVTGSEGSGHVGVQVTHPILPLEEAAAGVGLANMAYDQDGFVRRSYLGRDYAGQTRISFPLAVVAEYTGADATEIAWDATTDAAYVKVGAADIPLRSDGSFQINFAGGAGTFPTYSFYQVLQGLIPAEWLRDKIVLVGASDETLHDTFATPFFNDGPMPGVEVHANAVATLLNGQALHPLPLAIGIIMVLIFSAATSLLLGRLGPWRGLAVTAGEAALLIAGAVVLFNVAHIWLPLVGPLFAVLGCYATITGYRFVREESERRRIRSIFGRYVTDDVVQELVEADEDIALGGKRQRVTMLFSDIRGFTPMSERMSPEDVVGLLNEYFEAMTNCIFEQGGSIDKFVGDCIMALWGAPIPAPDDAARAVRTAVLMRIALSELQEKWQAEGREPFDTGVGINTAEVVVGNIGSHRRMDYTVIGDGVNLAARLESATKDLGAAVVISTDTYELVQENVIARPLEPIMVKGKEQPVQTYEVLGWQDPDGSKIMIPGAVEEQPA